ncbi:hypothetical protein BH10ACI2_BH10ACI2_07850 [soil metagenome]
MKYVRIFLIAGFLLGSSISTFAQISLVQSEQLDMAGVKFNYPSGWAIRDMSGPTANEFVLDRADLEVQVKVSVLRTRLNSPEKIAEAKRNFVDQYIETTTRSLIEADAKPVAAPQKFETASIKFDGVRIKAAYDGAPGAVEIVWAVIENKMVLLSFFGSDVESAKAALAWDMIRKTLKIAPPPTSTGIPAAVPVAVPKKPAN